MPDDVLLKRMYLFRTVGLSPGGDKSHNSGLAINITKRQTTSSHTMYLRAGP